MKIQSEEVTKSETLVKKEFSSKDSILYSSELLVNKKDVGVINNSSSTVKIKGKVDDKNPLIYYNVHKGDTISLFTISGNAEVVIETNSDNSNHNLESYSKETKSEDKVNSSKSESVIDDVKSTLKKVDKKTVETVKKDLSFTTYLTFFGWGIASISLIIIILAIRKSTFWTSIINKFKRNG